MQTSGSFSGDQIRRVSSALGANTGWLWLSVEDGCIDAGPGLETAMAGVPCVPTSLLFPCLGPVAEQASSSISNMSLPFHSPDLY